MKHVSTIGAVIALAGSIAGNAALAQSTGSSAAGAAATPATAPSPAASKPTRKARRRAHVPVGDPGVVGATGGTPEASSRTPGGPPPGMKTGITFPLPSIGKDGTK